MENININANNTSLACNELKVFTLLRPGDKIQLNEQTTWVRKKLTGDETTTFICSLGNSGSLVQATSRWLVGAETTACLDKFKDLVPQWISKIGTELASSTQQSKCKSLAHFLVKVREGLRYLQYAHNSSTELDQKWRKETDNIIKQITLLANTHMTSSRIEWLEAQFNPLTTLQPGDKLQRLSETTQLRQTQQEAPTRILKSLGNSQTSFKKIEQDAARSVVGADSIESAAGFKKEVLELLSELSLLITLSKERNNLLGIQKLHKILLDVKGKLPMLRDTHDPTFMRRHQTDSNKLLESSGDLDRVDFFTTPDPFDTAWAAAAQQLLEHVNTTFKKELPPDKINAFTLIENNALYNNAEAVVDTAESLMKDINKRTQLWKEATELVKRVASTQGKSYADIYWEDQDLFLALDQEKNTAKAFMSAYTQSLNKEEKPRDPVLTNFEKLYSNQFHSLNKQLQEEELLRILVRRHALIQK